MGLIRLFLACVVAADHWRKAALEPHSLYLTDYFKLGFNSGYAVMFFYVMLATTVAIPVGMVWWFVRKKWL